MIPGETSIHDAHRLLLEQVIVVWRMVAERPSKNHISKLTTGIVFETVKPYLHEELLAEKCGI